MHTTNLTLAAILSATLGTAYGEDCGSYPYTTGMTVEDVQGGTRILATASVGVSFDDVDAVNDARDESTLAAKAIITQFFNELVKSDENLIKAVKETKSMQGDAKQASRNEVIERVKRLSSSSSFLLRGVVPLGDCYTPGKEFRVSVGLKPETVAAAGNAANAIGRSLTTQPATVLPPAPSSSSTGHPDQANGTIGQPLNPVPGFSNTQNLKGF